MRFHRLAPFVAGAAVVLLAGCSGGSSPSSLPAGAPSGSSAVALGTSAQSFVFARGDRTGVAPQFLSRLHLPDGTPHFPPSNSSFKYLAVSDFATEAVEILSPLFKYQSSISSGLASADGDWIDLNGNLYVADYVGAAVQEYAPGSTSPSATYSSGLADPINVTTDTKGNVYVADYTADTVAEYAQGKNTIINQCSPGGGPEGVVVDYKGDVFVSYNNSSTGAGNIAKYIGGLSGCKETVLRVTLGVAGGLQLAYDGSLVAADQLSGVDIIPPPYTSIASTITGGSDYFHVALSRFDKFLFIADPRNADVLVVKYPSGTPVATLNSANGLSDPAGVAAYMIAK